MPAKKDVKCLARRSKMEPGSDRTGDRSARHSESGGARYGHGSLDRRLSRHKGADVEEGAENDWPRKRSRIGKEKTETIG